MKKSSFRDMLRDERELDFDITKDKEDILQSTGQKPRNLRHTISQRRIDLQHKLHEVNSDIKELNRKIREAKKHRESPDISEFKAESKELERERALMNRELNRLDELYEEISMEAQVGMGARHAESRRRLAFAKWLTAIGNGLLAIYHITYGFKIAAPIFAIMSIWFFNEIYKN